MQHVVILGRGGSANPRSLAPYASYDRSRLFIYFPHPSAQIADMRPRLALAAAALATMSCGRVTEPRRPGQPIHIFRADASTVHDTIYSFCGIEGVLPTPQTSLPPWTGQASVTLYRWVATTHGVVASRQVAATVAFSITEDSSALVLTLHSPVDTTLIGAALSAPLAPTNGTWTCPANFPFSNDASLLANGYQAVPAPSGTWSLAWMRPID
jgi:xanthine/CO dehydrogenase XdhC/CoxF family maturation factor